MSDIYVATSSFVTDLDGETVRVRRHVTRVREGHPLLEGREHLFEPLDVQFDVESATQDPGEKRCPDCGFEAKNAVGLAVHQRSHD